MDAFLSNWRVSVPAAAAAGGALYMLYAEASFRLKNRGKTLPPVYWEFGCLPIVGAAIPFLIDPLALARRAEKRCGDCFTIKIFGMRITFLSGPDAQENFCKARDDELSQKEAYSFAVPLFGEGVIYDCPLEKRTEQIKTVTNSLHTGALGNYVPQVCAENSKEGEKIIYHPLPRGRGVCVKRCAADAHLSLGRVLSLPPALPSFCPSLSHKHTPTQNHPLTNAPSPSPSPSHSHSPDAPRARALLREAPEQGPDRHLHCPVGANHLNGIKLSDGQGDQEYPPRQGEETMCPRPSILYCSAGKEVRNTFRIEAGNLRIRQRKRPPNQDKASPQHQHTNTDYAPHTTHHTPHTTHHTPHTTHHTPHTRPCTCRSQSCTPFSTRDASPSPDQP
jgi:hypothetical protein